MMTKYRIRIVGKNCTYFLNLLIQRNITIYSFEKSDKYLIIVISLEDYKKIKKIRSSYKIEVLEVYGSLHYKNIIKNNWFFILSFFLSLLLLIFSSFFIYDIEVETSDLKIKKMILEDLKVREIAPFRLKKDYDYRTKVISEILLEERNNIEWLDIKTMGTKYKVFVVERVIDNSSDECYPSNIVANKDAFITNIDATYGEVNTALFRYVKKGDILISGDIHNKEDIMNRRCASGKVFGEVWYQVKVEVPKHYHEENVTGRIHRSIGYEFFHFKSKDYFKTYKRKEIPILDNPILHSRLYYLEAMETKVIDKAFTIKNIDKYGVYLAEKKLLLKLPKDSKIIKKKILKKEENNSRIIVEVFFKVNEDIGIKKRIEEESYVRESE